MNFILESIENIEEYWRPIEKVKFEKIIKISAKTNVNVDELCAELREQIDILDDKMRSTKSIDKNRPSDAGETFNESVKSNAQRLKDLLV